MKRENGVFFLALDVARGHRLDAMRWRYLAGLYLDPDERDRMLKFRAASIRAARSYIRSARSWRIHG